MELVLTSGADKRKHPYDDNTPRHVKRERMSDFPEPAKVDTSLMNEVVCDGSQGSFPYCPAYDKALYNINDECRKLLKDFCKALEPHASVSKEARNMLSKAEEAMKLPVPERVMVALLGNTGAGKSSVACRLTDEPEMAKELSAGESVTSVPALYMHRLPGQKAAYAAEIQYYTISKCLGRANSAASTAFQTFRTLFRDQAEFSSQGAAELHLSMRYKYGTQMELIETMVKWCESFFCDFDKQHGAGYTRCQGNTMSELRDQIDPLRAPNHFADKSSLWPLVEKVTVGIPSSQVLQYITIVDLPGITDTNKLRALWYVADVGRICDDAILEEALSNYAERFRGTLAVVATKIDLGLTHALARDMNNKGQSVGDYFEVEKNIHKLKVRRKEVHRLIGLANASQKTALRDKQEQLEDAIRKEEPKRLDCLDDARITNVRKRFCREKQKHVPEGATLPIYFVSNTQYELHMNRDGEMDFEPRFGDIKDTGIPALRAYALGLAARGVWEAYTNHLIVTVKVLFNSALGWALDSPTNNQAGLVVIVNDKVNLWNALEKITIDKMAREFDSGIIQRLRLGATHSYAGALQHLRKITSKPWWSNTFLAFYLKGGRHFTQLVGSESWNEDFISSQTRDILNPAWRELLLQSDTFFDEPVNKLMKSIEDLPVALGINPVSVPLPLNSFKRVLDAHISSIQAAHRKHKQRYTQSLANIKLDATLDQHTGHFAQAMQPCYDKGQRDKGDGVCFRNEDRLHRHFDCEDPIGQAIDKLSVALKGNVSYHGRALCVDLDTIASTIIYQFELTLKRHNETSREKEARHRMVHFLRGVMPEIERIDAKLDSVRRHYPGW
ncbi:hypothetical protein MBLNU13_g11149t1 [Cladosporium sp. NU13]